MLLNKKFLKKTIANTDKYKNDSNTIEFCIRLL